MGGQVALSLACSGIGGLHFRDDDDLRSVNLARHVLADYLVGYPKTVGIRSTREEASRSRRQTGGNGKVRVPSATVHVSEPALDTTPGGGDPVPSV